jgi:hypothetical protein
MHKSEKTRHEHDEYHSPRWVVDAALAEIRGNPVTVMDIGAGSSGIWGREARKLWPKAWIGGVEIQKVTPPLEYDDWWNTSIEDWVGEGTMNYDLIMGNPPFKNIDYILPRCLERLDFGGCAVFLLRLAYLEGQRRRDTLYKKTPPAKVVVLSKRPQFYGNGNYRAYGLFYWRQGWEGETRISWL